MARREIEILPEHYGEIPRWMERILLKLGVPSTHVTYRVENTPTPSGPMVLGTVTVLPHPALLEFKGEVNYGVARSMRTALSLAS